MREIPKQPGHVLRKALQEKPMVGTVYRHHTGDIYKLMGKSIDCKTNKVLANYELIESAEWVKNPNYFLDGGYQDDSILNIPMSRPIEDFVAPRFVEVRKIELYLATNERQQIAETIINSGENRL